jgi:hypothetical protein
VADLCFFEAYEFGAVFELCMGVAHCEFDYFWGWKTFDELFSRVRLLFGMPVIFRSHFGFPFQLTIGGIFKPFVDGGF